MRQDKNSLLTSWITEKNKQRADRALERQRSYQQKKAAELRGREKETVLMIMQRSTLIRQRLEYYCGKVSNNVRVLEVGSGAHGLIFGFGKGFRVGVDPLAEDYKRLFPVWQCNVQTVAAIGEKLPFANSSFDLVLSDNVIDHAEDPVAILHDITRVLKPSGLLYFTVNVHHPVYQLGSAAHGLWNALGINYEISPFADHTIHFTEKHIKKVFTELPLKILHESSNIGEIKSAYKRAKTFNSETLFKRVFFKNALFEIIASRKSQPD